MNVIDARSFLFANHLLSPGKAALFVWATRLASVWGLLAWLALVAILARRDRWRALAACAGSIALGALAQFGLKYVFARPRPWRALGDVHAIGHLERGYSFPSGHSTVAFALATAIALRWPRLGWVAFPLAALVACSRVVLGMHYPGDVLGGAVLGTLSALAVHRLLRRRPAIEPATPAIG